MSEVADQLSARQEAFCAAYIQLGSAAAAARRAGYSAGAAKSQGWRLLQDSKVRARLDELRRTQGGPAGGGVDLAGLMAKLEAVYDDARQHREYNSAVRAVEAQARLLERFGAMAATPETQPDDPDPAEPAGADPETPLGPDAPAVATDAASNAAAAPERPPDDDRSDDDPPGDGPPPSPDTGADVPPDAGDMAPGESVIGDPPMRCGPIRDFAARFAADPDLSTSRRTHVDAGPRPDGLGWLRACIRVDLGYRHLSRKLRDIRADMLAHVVEKYEKRFGLPVPSVAGC